jgi:rhomboid protease GluP
VPGRWPATALLLAVEVALLPLAGALGRHGARPAGSILEPSHRALCELGALNAAAVALHGQYWRLLAATVLHVNAAHLAYNAVWLLFLGAALEAEIGSLRLLAVYAGTGAAATATSYAVAAPLLGAGASGAISGIGGALTVLLWRRERRERDGGRRLAVAATVALYLAIGAATPGVDSTAHLGGLLAGAAAMLVAEAGGRGRPRWVAGLAVPVVAALALAIAGTATFAPAPAALLPACSGPV